VSEVIVIDHGYCGPPDAGNGGYVGGVLADRLGGTVEANFRRPVPLGRELQLDREHDGAMRLYDQGNLLVEAAPSTVTLAVPKAPTLQEAEAASGRFLGWKVHTPFVRCFGCGIEREPATACGSRGTGRPREPLRRALAAGVDCRRGWSRATRVRGPRSTARRASP
jgi:hypothetical protein